MGDLSDFQGGQIIGVCLAGTYVPKMVTLLGVARAAVSTVMTEYANRGMTSTAKRNSDQKPRLSERGGHTMKTNVSKNHRTTAANVQAELNIHFEDHVSTKTVQQQLHKSTIHNTAATATPLVTENNAKSRKIWCDDHNTWTSDVWKYVVGSDKSSFTLFPTSDWVYVWKTPKETYKPECLLPTVKHGGRSVIIWEAISWYSAGPIITPNVQITASDYVNIFGNWVHHMVKMSFPNNDAMFQDYNWLIHTAKSIQSCFEEHEDALQHLPWPAQSQDLNITEPLWSVLESKVRSRFPP
jgi:hypothetical protein